MTTPTNNLQKMLAGEWYTSNDPELVPIHEKSMRLCMKFNTSDPDDKAGRRKILEQLVPHINDDTQIESPVEFDYGEFTKFGKRCFVNYGLTCMDTGWVTIGDDVHIGPNVTLACPIHPMGKVPRRYNENEKGELFDILKSKPITLGNDVWLGAGVIVCGGVTIGEGTVIGAGSVVTRDIPANVFAAGNPCRVIREITDENEW